MTERKPVGLNANRMCPFKDAKSEYHECPALTNFLTACKEVHTAAKAFNDKSFKRKLKAAQKSRIPKKGSKFK